MILVYGSCHGIFIEFYTLFSVNILVARQEIYYFGIL